MGKKKKNGSVRQQKINSVGAITKKTKTAIEQATRIADAEGGYSRTLKVHDEKEFRRIEKELDSIDRKIFRAMMLKRVQATMNDPGGSTSNLEIQMRSDPKLFLDAFSYTASEIIGEYVYSTSLKSEDIDTCSARAKDVAGKIPEEYRNPAKVYTEVILAQPFADAYTKTINAIIDWEKILPGTNIFVWSKNFIDFLQNMCGQEFLDKYSSKRDHMFEAAARGVAAAITEMNLQSFTSEFYPQYKAFPTTSKTAALPRTLNLPISVPGTGLFGMNSLQPPAPSFSTAPGVSTAQNVDAALENVICGLLAPLIPKARGLLDQIGKEFVLSGFSPVDIIFIVAETCKDYRDTDDLPTFIDPMLFVATQLMPLAVNKSLKGFENPVHKPDIVLHTATMLTEPDRSDDESNIRAKATTLSQLILNCTAQLIPTELHIPTTYMDTFIRAGYTEWEAAALCGLIKGLNYCSDNQILYHNSLKPYIQDLENEDFGEAPDEDAIRSHVEEEMRLSIEKTQAMRKEVEVARNQFLRERRTTIYRADRAEQELEARDKELAEAREQIRKLQNENRELQSSIFDMSLKDSEKDEETSLQFPLDIAKNIRFSVFGGTTGWVKEQSRRFPNVYFYDVDTYPQPDIVENSDIILLNTFVMHHKYFNNIQDIAKKKGIPVHFIRNKGFNNGSKQIFEVWEEYSKSNQETP